MWRLRNSYLVLQVFGMEFLSCLFLVNFVELDGFNESEMVSGCEKNGSSSDFSSDALNTEFHLELWFYFQRFKLSKAEKLRIRIIT